MAHWIGDKVTLKARPLTGHDHGGPAVGNNDIEAHSEHHRPEWVGGMGSPIPCSEQGEVDPRGSGGTLNCRYSAGELLKAPVPNEP